LKDWPEVIFLKKAENAACIRNRIWKLMVYRTTGHKIMLGYRFSKYSPPPEKAQSDFDRLLKIFMQLVLISSGNVGEALQWLTEVDRQHNLTNPNYGIGDFIEDLKRKGYITDEGPKGEFKLNAKGEQNLRQSALEEIFGKLKKTKSGDHNTRQSGRGDEQTTEQRDYEFGDTLEQLSVTDSLRNAQINHGLDNFIITEDDLEVMESEFKTQTSTVLMIDISHSMILYGEDRITPAKKVAMALAELITKKYPKDTPALNWQWTFCGGEKIPISKSL
jgi:Ca-activated chloride channel homolog